MSAKVSESSKPSPFGREFPFQCRHGRRPGYPGRDQPSFRNGEGLFNFDFASEFRPHPHHGPSPGFGPGLGPGFRPGPPPPPGAGGIGPDAFHNSGPFGPHRDPRKSGGPGQPHHPHNHFRPAFGYPFPPGLPLPLAHPKAPSHPSQFHAPPRPPPPPERVEFGLFGGSFGLPHHCDHSHQRHHRRHRDEHDNAVGEDHEEKRDGQHRRHGLRSSHGRKGDRVEVINTQMSDSFDFGTNTTIHTSMGELDGRFKAQLQELKNLYRSTVQVMDANYKAACSARKEAHKAAKHATVADEGKHMNGEKQGHMDATNQQLPAVDCHEFHKAEKAAKKEWKENRANIFNELQRQIVGVATRMIEELSAPVPAPTTNRHATGGHLTNALTVDAGPSTTLKKNVSIPTAAAPRDVVSQPSNHEQDRLVFILKLQNWIAAVQTCMKNKSKYNKEHSNTTHNNNGCRNRTYLWASKGRPSHRGSPGGGWTLKWVDGQGHPDFSRQFHAYGYPHGSATSVAGPSSSSSIPLPRPHHFLHHPYPHPHPPPFLPHARWMHPRDVQKMVHEHHKQMRKHSHLMRELKRKMDRTQRTLKRVNRHHDCCMGSADECGCHHQSRRHGGCSNSCHSEEDEAIAFGTTSTNEKSKKHGGAGKEDGHPSADATSESEEDEDGGDLEFEMELTVEDDESSESESDEDDDHDGVCSSDDDVDDGKGDGKHDHTPMSKE